MRESTLFDCTDESGSEEIRAVDVWPTNAHLIADCARLGYLQSDWTTLDPTYGYGTFWKVWKPDVLVACDGAEAKSPIGYAVDFTDLPWPDRHFDVVVFDPPYKLNGTPTEATDARYGVHVVSTWQDRHRLIRDGILECLRVLRAGGTLLVKCQDQVCSGAIRWQTVEFTNHAEAHGARLVDRFDLLGSSRPQPAGRRQVHAHGRPSTLLVFRWAA